MKIHSPLRKRKTDWYNSRYSTSLARSGFCLSQITFATRSTAWIACSTMIETRRNERRYAEERICRDEYAARFARHGSHQVIKVDGKCQLFRLKQPSTPTYSISLSEPNSSIKFHGASNCKTVLRRYVSSKHFKQSTRKSIEGTQFEKFTWRSSGISRQIYVSRRYLYSWETMKTSVTVAR